MRRTSNAVLFAAVIAALVAFGVAHMVMPTGSQSAARETALERIKRTGVIRCGYIASPPYLLKDPNTGQMSGPAYELLQAIGKDMQVRVEWAEEAGWGNFHEGLNANRYDLMCTPVWESGFRARIALLTRPLYYNGMYAFARAEDSRFDKSPDELNKPDVRIIVIDGDITQALRKMRFPQAQELAMSQLGDTAQGIMNLATHKGDVVLENADNVRRFNENSKEKIKVVAGGQPLQMFGNVIAVRLGEFDLKAALDATIDSLYNSGEASMIVQKYAASIQPAAPGYRTAP